MKTQKPLDIMSNVLFLLFWLASVIGLYHIIKESTTPKRNNIKIQLNPIRNFDKSLEDAIKRTS